MEEIKFPIDNTYLHYVKFGSGEKNLAIVSGISLRGFEGFGGAISKQYSLLANEYTCYVFDRKVKLPAGYSIEELSEDLYRVLKANKIDKADFLGLSQGGMISIAMAIHHPEMVNKLVLGSTAACSGTVSEENWNLLDSYLKVYDIKNFNINFYKSVYSEKYFKENERALSYVARLGTKEQCDRFRILSDAIRKFDYRDRLSEIQCPAFVIGAEKDLVFGPDASRELAKLLNCNLYIYENQAHAVYDEVTDYSKRVLEFLQETV